MTDEESGNDIFRGHLEECMQNFGNLVEAKYPKGAKNRLKALEPMANFCKTQTVTVSNWFHNGTLPFGECKMRLICYLTSFGYRVIELERLPRVFRNIVEIVGYGLMTIDEMTKKVGYTQASSLMMVLNGQYGTSKEKEEKMYETWKVLREELVKAKTDAKEKFLLDLSDKVLPVKIQTTQAEPVKVVQRESPREIPKSQNSKILIMEALILMLKDPVSEQELELLKGSRKILFDLAGKLVHLGGLLVNGTQKEGG